MPRTIVSTGEAPASQLYSQAVQAGPWIIVSGQTGAEPATRRVVGDTVGEQTRQALANCQAILAAAGASLDDVVEVGVLLSDPGELAGFNEEYGRWFPADPPARWVAKLGVELPGVLISIRMSAYTG